MYFRRFHHVLDYNFQTHLIQILSYIDAHTRKRRNVTFPEDNFKNHVPLWHCWYDNKPAIVSAVNITAHEDEQVGCFLMMTSQVKTYHYSFPALQRLDPN